MPVQTAAGLIDPGQIPQYITAVGALGVAAFGAVDSLGKSLLAFKWPVFDLHGLPYAGFGKVRSLLALVGPAMAVTYGADYEALVRQQYRVGRSAGQAPDTIRQGVRLGLTYLAPDKAAAVIQAVWGMSPDSATQLAQALSTTPAAPATSAAAPAAGPGLAGRFATALDTHVQAAFELADDVYTSRAQFWAGAVAVVLSLGYYGAQASHTPAGWVIALVVGLFAVPIAPVAKDLSSSVSNALAALGSLRGAAK